MRLTTTSSCAILLDCSLWACFLHNGPPKGSPKYLGREVPGVLRSPAPTVRAWARCRRSSCLVGVDTFPISLWGGTAANEPRSVSSRSFVVLPSHWSLSQCPLSQQKDSPADTPAAETDQQGPPSPILFQDEGKLTIDLPRYSNPWGPPAKAKHRVSLSSEWPNRSSAREPRPWVKAKLRR